MSTRIVLVGSPDGHRLAATPSVISYGSVHYDLETDELLIEVSEEMALKLTPGRDMAGAINLLLAEVEKAGTDPADRDPEDRCYGCNAPVIAAVTSRGKMIQLDREPNESGAYLLTRDGRARSLRPFEEPVGRTYRKHLCKGGRT